MRVHPFMLANPLCHLLLCRNPVSCFILLNPPIALIPRSQFPIFRDHFVPDISVQHIIPISSSRQAIMSLVAPLFAFRIETPNPASSSPIQNPPHLISCHLLTPSMCPRGQDRATPATESPQQSPNYKFLLLVGQLHGQSI